MTFKHLRIRKALMGIICLLSLCFQAGLAQQRAGSVAGQVTDELGALVVGASVTLIAADGTQKSSVTNAEGTYTFNPVTPGRYTVRFSAPGFSSYEKAAVEVTPGKQTTQNARLVIATAKQEVTIVEGRGLNTDASRNADAVVLSGQDLDVLPDDPDALAAAAQAMAGPTVGPDGAQIFIDGFTGGRMPPKESIREVRINQNPFNAENNNIGFGRIDILTKPG